MFIVFGIIDVLHTLAPFDSRFCNLKVSIIFSSYLLIHFSFLLFSPCFLPPLPSHLPPSPLPFLRVCLYHFHNVVFRRFDLEESPMHRLPPRQPVHFIMNRSFGIMDIYVIKPACNSDLSVYPRFLWSL